MARLDIYRRADHLWAWRLIAGNGRIIATDGGQGYENEADCRRTAIAVVTGLYAPKALDLAPAHLEPGWVELRCTTCDTTAIGRPGEWIEHADGEAHVHHMTYGDGE